MLKRGLCDLSRPDAAAFIDAFATEDDRRQAERFASGPRRTQSVAGRALIRALLREVSEIAPRGFALATTASGRPRILDADGVPASLDISIAHSRDLVVAAVTDRGRIGIDVEHLGARRFDGIAAKFFGRQEQDAVRFGGARAFYRIWTSREAFAKAMDRGIAGALERMDYFGSADDIVSIETEQQRWVCRREQYGDKYVMTVAVALPTGSPIDAVSVELRRGSIVFPRQTTAVLHRTASP
jgi:phosphopantetheinyl transferase